MENLLKIKAMLRLRCTEFVTDKISIIVSEMKIIYESIQDDSKSTAGDKHETGRAMAHLELEKLGVSLAAVNKMNDALLPISYNEISAKISVGSVVITNFGNYYIAISAGKYAYQNKEYYMVSPASPIGAALLNVGNANEFSFHGKVHLIEKVF